MTDATYPPPGGPDYNVPKPKDPPAEARMPLPLPDQLPVHAAFAAAMNDIQPIGKDQRNEQQGFAFRGIDDVLNAIHHVLVAHGLFYLPFVESAEWEWRQSKSGTEMVHVFLTVRYDFWAADGTGPLPMRVAAEGRDSSDKATSKAMSGALKYGLIQAFAIPISGIADPDTVTLETVGPTIPPEARRNHVNALKADLVERYGADAAKVAWAAADDGRPPDDVFAEAAAKLQKDHGKEGQT